MKAVAEQPYTGKVECPECGRRTCQVFASGDWKCFHPACGFRKSVRMKGGQPRLPLRKKPKASVRALGGFGSLSDADPGHKYLRSHSHRGDITLQIDGLNVRQYRDSLVVPMFSVSGRLRNLQYIDSSGTKRFLKGCGTRGLFHPIGAGNAERVWIVEGWATVVSLFHATGDDVLVAFSSGNVVNAAKHARAGKWKTVAICADTDAELKAEEIAGAIDGWLFVPEFRDGETGSDANDLAQIRGVKELARQIKRNTSPIPPPPDLVDVMADMPPAKFKKLLPELAQYLGVSPEILAAKVQTRRQEIRFPEVVPWADAVNGEELADSIHAELHRHIYIGESASVAVALWVLFSHLVDEFRIAPLLHITSPEKRCGKSLLLDLCSRLVARPLPASNMSPATVFRTIEMYAPTLLIDEADTFLRDNEPLRGVLNSGHTRSAAYILRCVGDDNEPRRFSTWGAKAIASIRDLPDTITDRSVVIPMRRKTEEDRRRRLGETATGDVFDDLRRKIARWCDDNGESIGKEPVPCIRGLNDRAMDNWRPLLQISKRLGGEWFACARDAALELDSHYSSDSDSRRVLLLQDLRKLFEDEEANFLRSESICNELGKLQERPWPEYSKGKEQITPVQLAALLKPFGIEPKQKKLTQRDGTKRNLRGYYKREFKDAWARYC